MAAAELPLFPLDTVLMPGGQLQLRLFEQRYLDMVRNCAAENSGFGVCLKLEAVAGELPQHTACGTEALISDFYLLDDGLLGITTAGARRYRIRATHARTDGLLIGAVEWLDEPEPTPLPEQYQLLADILERILGQLPAREPQPERSALQDAAWVSYRLSELLPLRMLERQHLLEMPGALERLQRLLELLPKLQPGRI